jgi:aspartyl-tRNA synthetase
MGPLAGSRSLTLRRQVCVKTLTAAVPRPVLYRHSRLYSQTAKDGAEDSSKHDTILSLWRQCRFFSEKQNILITSEVVSNIHRPSQ